MTGVQARARLSTLLESVRFAGGVFCVLVAGWLFVSHALSAFRGFNANVRQNSWRNTLDRLVAPGDMTGLDKGFQEAALAIVPKNATYTVIGPPSPDVAERAYGMNAITQAGLDPFLRYLLLPARGVSPQQQPEYVLCYGCDTTPWDGRTTWLWRNEHGLAIGRVNEP